MDPQQNQAPYGQYGTTPVPSSAGQPPPYGSYSGYGYTGIPYTGAPSSDEYQGYNYRGGYSYGGYQAAEFLSPRRLLKVLRRRWFLILTVFLLGVAASVLYFWKADKVYRSEALIEMSVRGKRIVSDVVQQDYGQAVEVFNTRLARLRGTRFAMLAEQRFQLLWDRYGTPLPTEEVPEFGEISYDLIRMSSLVKITAKATDPMVAAISANAAAEAAEAFFEEENQSMSDKAVEWLANQAAIQRNNLTVSENDLLAFRTENNLDTLEAQQEADRQSLLTLNELKTEYENQLLTARESLKAFERVDHDLSDGLDLPPGLPNREAILGEYQRYQSMVSEKKVMLETKTPVHPDIVQANLVLNQIEDNIQQLVASSRQGFAQQVNVVGGQLEKVNQRIEELTSKVSRQELHLVEKRSQLNTLIRERDAAENAYNNVLQRIEQARLAADEETATLKLVERGIPEEDPIHPRLLILLPLGSMAGLGLGFLLALTLETVEDRIFSIAELEAEISSRIIGIVPHIAGGKRADLAQISLNQKFGQVAESFNAIRVILDHVNNNRLKEVREKGHSHPGGHVVMFCSASPSEGKTVSATNVAITAARAGQKTLLIDCDMRRPRLAKVFAEGMEAKEGEDDNRFSLLHHLANHGGKDFEKIILPGPTDHLDLMASLASSDINPADLLGGKNIQALIAWARKNYDRVIIDTPPIGLISDGLVISNLSDGVVTVCRAGQTRHRALRHVLLQFKGVGSNVIGIIVNDFNMRKAAEPLDVHYKEFAAGYEKSVYKEVEKNKKPSGKERSTVPEEKPEEKSEPS